MSSSDSDSEAAADRKAKFAFALAFEPLKAIEVPKVEPKVAPSKPAVVGFQQPDFREIPKSLDTLMAEDWKTDVKDDVFGDSFVLGEAAMTSKTTREEYYRRNKDLTISGLKMSAKEKEEHRLVQQKGAKMLDKSLAEQITYFDKPEAELEQTTMDVDDDNGGVQLFVGAKTRIKEVKAPEPLKVGLAVSGRPAGWDIKRSKRVESDNDSDSDSEESRKRKVAMAGVVVDFASIQGYKAPAKVEKKEIQKEPESQSAMDVDTESIEKSAEKEKKERKDKKDKKHKKDKKDKKDKKEKRDKNKKRKREASNSDDSESLG